MKNFSLYFISLLILSSCSFKYDVYIFNADRLGADLIIDGNIVPLDSGKLFTRIKLNKGSHNISSINTSLKSINLKVPSLITLGNYDFVTVPIEYNEYTNKKLRESRSIKGPIILGDSIVVYNKGIENQEELLIAVNKKIVSTKKIIDAEENEFRKQNLIKTLLPKLRILKSTDGLIQKHGSWDFTADEIPEEIEFYDFHEKPYGYKHHKTKHVILELNAFKNISKAEKLYKVEEIEDPVIAQRINEYLGLLSVN